jgi:type I restriction enzyme M protein
MVALKGKTDIGDQINKKILGPLAQANKLSDSRTMPRYSSRRGYEPGEWPKNGAARLLSVNGRPAGLLVEQISGT